MMSIAHTILVVEDDHLILLNARIVLENAGHVVLAANNAEDALTLLDRHPEITALFTDIAMPGAMDGIALAAEAHRRRPDLSVFITSGAAEADVSGLLGSARFLPKPYTAAMMTQLLAA